MKYYLELRIYKFIKANDLDRIIRKPLAGILGEVGKAVLAIPEYQSYQSTSKKLLELNFNGRILFFKYIKVSISLLELSGGVKMIRRFLQEKDLLQESKLLFADERYDLLQLEEL